MTKITAPADGAVHLIDHQLAVADARAALEALRAATDAAATGSRLGLDLSGTDPTAPALQLLIAGARALVEAGQFDGLGPTAAATLAALGVEIPQPQREQGA